MFRVFPDTAACALLGSLRIATSSASALGREPWAAPRRLLLPPQALLSVAFFVSVLDDEGPSCTDSEFMCAFTVLPLDKQSDDWA